MATNREIAAHSAYNMFSLYLFGFPISVFMPPTSKKLRGHIGLGLSVQSVIQSVSLSVCLSVCLSVMCEHSVRNC